MQVHARAAAAAVESIPGCGESLNRVQMHRLEEDAVRRLYNSALPCQTSRAFVPRYLFFFVSLPRLP